jgi:hypothetical protein
MMSMIGKKGSMQSSRRLAQREMRANRPGQRACPVGDFIAVRRREMAQKARLKWLPID